MTIVEMFEKYHDDEFLKFERIENPPTQRPDLCAFLILDSIVPNTTDIVGAAEHDEIFLGVDIEELEKLATEDQVRDLIRCGVMWSDEYDSLRMFV